MKRINYFEQFVNESRHNFKVGDVVSFIAGGKLQTDEIIKVDGIYLKLKDGGSIPFQSVIKLIKK